MEKFHHSGSHTSKTQGSITLTIIKSYNSKKIQSPGLYQHFSKEIAHKNADLIKHTFDPHHKYLDEKQGSHR